MAMPLVFPIDVEWYVPSKTGDLGPDGSFRCATWMSGKKLFGTKSFDKFKGIIESLPEKTEFIGHNLTGAEFDAFNRWGIPLPDRFSINDTMLASRLLEPQTAAHDLKFLAKERGYYYSEEWANPDEDVCLEYCSKDTFMSRVLADEYADTLTPETARVLSFTNKLSRAFFAVECAGLKLDVQQLRNLEVSYGARLGDLLARGVPPKPITDDREMRAILMKRYTKDLLIKKLGKTEDGQVQVSAKLLERLPKLTVALKDLIEARRLNDYRTLYIKRPLEMATPEGFIFPKYKILVAKTHRRSTKPAIQNWPEEARKVIVSRFEGGKIVAGDYKNLEARLFAWQCGCKSFLEALVEGGYLGIADRCFGWKIADKRDPKYKQLKSMILAVTYNVSPWLYAHNMTNDGVPKTMDDAERDFGMFFDMFPEIYDELESRKDYVWKHGKTKCSVPGVTLPVTILPDYVFQDERDYRRYCKRLENFACNWPTQNLASYVTGAALVEIQAAISGEQYGGYCNELHRMTKKGGISKSYAGYFPIAEVHDELVFDSTSGTAAECQELMGGFMVNNPTLHSLVPGFNCPLDTSFTIGDCWEKG